MNNSLNVNSGYSCVKQGSQQTCTSILTSTDGIPIGWCDSVDPTLATTSKLPVPTTYTTSGADSSFTVVTATSINLLAPLVQIIWKSEDLPTSSGAAVTTTPTFSPSATPSPDSSSSSSSGDHVGIGVGVAVAALVIIALLVWFFFRQRRRKRQAQTPMDISPSDDTKKQDPEVGGLGFKSELPAESAKPTTTIPLSELPEEARPQELGASPIQAEPIELPGRDISVRRPGGSPHVA